VEITIIWHLLLGAYELTHIFVWKEKEGVVIVLKMLGTCVPNLVVWVTRPLGFVCPYCYHVHCRHHIHNACEYIPDM